MRFHCKPICLLDLANSVSYFLSPCHCFFWKVILHAVSCWTALVAVFELSFELVIVSRFATKSNLVASPTNQGGVLFSTLSAVLKSQVKQVKGKKKKNLTEAFIQQRGQIMFFSTWICKNTHKYINLILRSVPAAFWNHGMKSLGVAKLCLMHWQQFPEPLAS